MNPYVWIANDVRLILIIVIVRNVGIFRTGNFLKRGIFLKKRGLGNFRKGSVVVKFIHARAHCNLFRRKTNFVSEVQYQSIDDDNSIVVVLVVALPRRSLGHRKLWSLMTVNCA